jgi:hypothetical protein
MKTGWNWLPKLRWTALTALAAGLALNAPIRAGESAGSGTEAKPASGCVCRAGKAKAAKPAKSAKPAKTSRAEKATPAKGTDAKPEPREITGSHLKQRVVLRRFPETIAPVEVFDREQLERRGEATLSGFLSRQATFR